jgi:hypothetical protein
MSLPNHRDAGAPGDVSDWWTVIDNGPGSAVDGGVDAGGEDAGHAGLDCGSGSGRGSGSG